jgi:CBS domain-containing protein
VFKNRKPDASRSDTKEEKMLRTIRDIIAGQEVFAAPSDLTVAEAAQGMRARKVGAALVVEGGKLVGMFTERDALWRVVAEGHDVRATRLAEVMTKNPQTIHPDESFARALHIMYEGRFRHVPVVEDGRPLGVVSARDALGPELEDFVLEMLRQDQARDILA